MTYIKLIIMGTAKSKKVIVTVNQKEKIRKDNTENSPRTFIGLAGTNIIVSLL